MASRYQIRGWPTRYHALGSAAQVHAIGHITLAYNSLAEAIDYIFQNCMNTEQEFSQRLFHKLNNRDRIDLLMAVIRSSRYHAEAKDRLVHLLRSYDICTGNRNILMHATFVEDYAGVLHLSKRSSNSPATDNRFHIPLSDLRTLAEQIQTLNTYAQELWVWLVFRNAFPANYRGTLKVPPLNKIKYPKMRKVLQAVPDYGTTLPDKPPKPHTLTPSQHRAIQLGEKRRPKSSRAKH